MKMNKCTNKSFVIEFVWHALQAPHAFIRSDSHLKRPRSANIRTLTVFWEYWSYKVLEQNMVRVLYFHLK